MTELVLRFEHLVGRAALKLWSDLPRDLQERMSRMLSVRMKYCAIISLCICTIIIRGPRIRQGRRLWPKVQVGWAQVMIVGCREGRVGDPQPGAGYYRDWSGHCSHSRKAQNPTENCAISQGGVADVKRSSPCL